MYKLVRVLAVAALAVAASSCGGGGMGSFTTSNSTPVVTMGTITAFGSVVVNGVHYDIASASMTRNGQSVTQADLAVGQIARVHGRKNVHDANGHADHVDVDDQLVGPITSIDVAGGSLVALGQTVTVDSGTSFAHDLSGLGALAVGDVIEVSGLVAADGHIAATRIEREPGSRPFQIIGTVANLDSTAHTFKINALTVDYSTAMVNGFSSGAPAEGDLIEAKGTTFDTAATRLTATNLSPAEDETTEANHGDHVEREGLITRFVSATDFDVAGKPVTTTSTTVFEGGAVTDLALNVRVEAEGQLDANNVLVADKIEIRKAGIAELKGNITAFDATAGTVTLLGVTVTVTADTRLEDRSEADVEHFSLANLAVGDTVEVRGFENPIGSGAITATKLERERPRTTVIVGGFFQATTAPQFTILGITIDATGATFSKNFRDTLTSDQFFAQAPGHVVFVSGTLNGTTVTADKIVLALSNDCADQGED
jgi:cytoskeletal protein CcmA (bactofilin family)